MNTMVFCVSARRPSAVLVMGQHAEIIWVVPEDDAPDYRAAGADQMIVVPDPADGRSPLSIARNAALDHAFAAGAVCVQTDDDFRWAKLRGPDDVWVPVTFGEMVGHLELVLSQSDAQLAGIPPTSNGYFARPGVSPQAFMIASMIAVAPSTPRFDETIPLKEDYDFTCRHLAEYGSVARSGDLVAEYLHYRNPGGAVSFRTDGIEEATCKILLDRWPQYLRRNPKRDHELIVKPRRS